LLGASGYIGQAFAAELLRSGRDFEALSRGQLDYACFGKLLGYLRSRRPEFLVNAAGCTGRPNVDACEAARAETLLGNVVLPQTVAHACEVAGIPWGHVSSGCIYSGGKALIDGVLRVEKDLFKPELVKLREADSRAIRGFIEDDPPNFCFRDPPCSFYSGSKALGEEALRGHFCYVWRLRIPFDELDGPRNYLTKIQSYPKAYDNLNSISHRGEFVRACLETWYLRAPFGTYNVTNPGHVTTRQVAEMIRRILKLDREFEFWEDDASFYAQAAKAPRSNCVLDTSKLQGVGIRLRPVMEALEASLRDWRKA
jgi:dTDP-4-dehydrorhamnose reductase